MTPGSRMSKRGQDIRRGNSTYLQPISSELQRLNRVPNGAEDAEYFQPEQKLLLQELVQGGGDCGRVSWFCVRINEVCVPRQTGISQSWIDAFLNPLTQAADIRVCDAIWEIAHILGQCLVHEIEAAGQKL